jgi:hypothetical protein
VTRGTGGTAQTPSSKSGEGIEVPSEVARVEDALNVYSERAGASETGGTEGTPSGESIEGIEISGEVARVEDALNVTSKRAGASGTGGTEGTPSGESSEGIVISAKDARGNVAAEPELVKVGRNRWYVRPDRDPEFWRDFINHLDETNRSVRDPRWLLTRLPPPDLRPDPVIDPKWWIDSAKRLNIEIMVVQKHVPDARFIRTAKDPPGGKWATLSQDGASGPEVTRGTGETAQTPSGQSGEGFEVVVGAASGGEVSGGGLLVGGTGGVVGVDVVQVASPCWLAASGVGAYLVSGGDELA